MKIHYRRGRETACGRWAYEVQSSVNYFTEVDCGSCRKVVEQEIQEMKRRRNDGS